MRRWIVFGLPVLLAGAALAWWLGASPPAAKHATAPVTTGKLEQTVLAIGRVQPKTLVSVGAQVSGLVKRLHVSLGQQVKAGQLIAEVDAEPQQTALRTAEAAVAALQAQLAARRASLVQAELTYRRQQALMELDATARAELEAARAALDSARAEIGSLTAQIEQSRTQVDTARINLGYTRIVAPMDGVVVAVVTKQGQTLNSFQTTPTIVMLAQMDVMTVRAEIAEADVGKVKPGMPVWFTTLGDSHTRHESKIAQVEPAPESITQEAGSGLAAGAAGVGTNRAVYYNAVFDVPNAEGRLRPSMTAQVSVLTASEANAVLVPAAALGPIDASGKTQAKVVDASGKVSQREVRVGLRTNTTAAVLSGLQAGENVVVGDAPPAQPADKGT
ncbi:MAG: efflux RND transporter periplasmic adaptor subunit [Ottowia sp.]|nr:efflux RND transporter periplasmic adaptor subunit [Ottowia sp.]